MAVNCNGGATECTLLSCPGGGGDLRLAMRPFVLAETANVLEESFLLHLLKCRVVSGLLVAIGRARLRGQRRAARTLSISCGSFWKWYLAVVGNHPL